MGCLVTLIIHMHGPLDILIYTIPFHYGGFSKEKIAKHATKILEQDSC